MIQAEGLSGAGGWSAANENFDIFKNCSQQFLALSRAMWPGGTSTLHFDD